MWEVVVEAGSDRLVRWALRVWLAIGGCLLVAGAWWALRDPLGLVLPPIVIAVVLVYLLDPVVTRVAARGVPRAVATLVAYVGAIVVGWVTLALAGPVLLGQARGLIDELPGIGAALQQSVNDQLLRFGVPRGSLLDLQPEALTQDLRDFLSTNQEQALGLLRGAGSVVSWVVHVALAVTLGPILAFYALADLPRLAAGARRLVPPSRRPEVVEVSSRIGRIVGAYFRGQLLVATFVGLATAVGLAAIGLPFWAVIGITTGAFNLVPLVGPTAGGVFGVLIALTVGGGFQQAVLVVLVMVAVQQVDNHLITPVIVARSVAIHPITVILALVVAGSAGGIPAMFFAIPFVAVVKLVVLHVVVTRVPSMAHLSADEDDDGPRRRGTVTALAQELRRSFERRLTEVAAVQRGRGVESTPRHDRGEVSARGEAGDDVSPPAGVAPPS